MSGSAASWPGPTNPTSRCARVSSVSRWFSPQPKRAVWSQFSLCLTPRNTPNVSFSTSGPFLLTQGPLSSPANAVQNIRGLKTGRQLQQMTHGAIGTSPPPAILQTGNYRVCPLPGSFQSKVCSSWSKEDEYVLRVPFFFVFHLQCMFFLEEVCAGRGLSLHAGRTAPFVLFRLEQVCAQYTHSGAGDTTHRTNRSPSSSY